MTELTVETLDNGFVVKYWNGREWRKAYIVSGQDLLSFIINPPKATE